MGWDPLTDEERTQLEKEKTVFHTMPGLSIVGNSLPLPITNAKSEGDGDDPALLALGEGKSKALVEVLKEYYPEYFGSS
jgi:hypothetical protein